MKPVEIIEVEKTTVACDGDAGASGHPRVFLTLKQDEGYEVVCPYCSKHFKLKEGAHVGGH